MPQPEATENVTDRFPVYHKYLRLGAVHHDQIIVIDDADMAEFSEQEWQHFRDGCDTCHAEAVSATERAMEFCIRKNEIISMLYESALPWEEASKVETRLCEIVNEFLDQEFPGWREVPHRVQHRE